jgi:hypothetical protein
MKRIIFATIILLFTSVLFAQNVSFYKHEVKASFARVFISELWLNSGTCNTNFSFVYSYRPVKWFWVGGNFIYYFGEKIHYDWREYNIDGRFVDFSKSKIKHSVVIAPEIRFSYFNTKDDFFYGALSLGVAWENGYDDIKQNYPRKFRYFHLTLLGYSCSFGKNNNFFGGGEIGAGFKGLINVHGGYRF